MSTTAEKTRWSTRRRTQALNSNSSRATIEYVPGADSGARAYFWIGHGSTHFADIDARTLARFVDAVRLERTDV